MSDDLLHKLRQELPPVFTRQQASKLLGGLYAPGTLANFDSRGDGPPRRVRIGRRIGYERDAFLAWLGERMKSCAENATQSAAA